MEQCLSDPHIPCSKLTYEETKALELSGYHVISTIDEGSYSLVYFGEYINKGKDQQPAQYPKDIPVKIALKVMKTKGTHPDFKDKFLVREMTIHSRISHPHIIHLHSILKINTKIILVMRYAERGNLFDHLVRYGRVEEKQARLWFRQIGVALSYLHAMAIAHRDIKCENILITANDNVKLCDFGFSRHCVDSKKRQIYSITFCGSLAYAPPELIKGIPYDPMVADIWSFGIVLYAMLNCSLPFKTGEYSKLLSMHIEKDYRFRTEALMKTSKEAVLLVGRMLEPNWLKRANITEVLQSPWMAKVPKLLHLTPMEESAMANINDFTMKKKIKIKQEANT